MRRIAPVLLFALACQRTASTDSGLSGGGGSFAPMGSTGDATSSGSSAAATSSGSIGDTASSGSSAATSSGSSAATSSTGDGQTSSQGTDPGSGCNGKIDLVFVITQNGQFVEYIDNLYNSYSAILATMQDELADFDLHVMFASSNDRWAPDNVCAKGMCPEEGGCPTKGYEDFPCWVYYDEEALTKCDNKTGAGVVFPAGYSATNQPCDLPDGQRYIVGDDPLFAERFACLSHTGIGGSTEMPGWALGEAVSLDLQEGCNAGFLRDDALLFAVLVSTHDYSPYNPYVWAQRVLEAKEYNQDMIVALGIANDLSINPGSLCEGISSGPPHETFQWAAEFEHHIQGSICVSTFAPFFAEAATMAADLCANGSPN